MEQFEILIRYWWNIFVYIDSKINLGVSTLIDIWYYVFYMYINKDYIICSWEIYLEYNTFVNIRIYVKYKNKQNLCEKIKRFG